MDQNQPLITICEEKTMTWPGMQASWSTIYLSDRKLHVNLRIPLASSTVCPFCNVSLPRHSHLCTTCAPLAYQVAASTAYHAYVLQVPAVPTLCTTRTHRNCPKPVHLRQEAIQTIASIILKVSQPGAFVLNYQFYRSSRRPRAQKATDSQQQTVTTALNHITIYSTILYCTIQCYTLRVLVLYVYFTCTLLVLLVLLVPYLYYFGTTQVPVVYYCDPPLSVSPDRKTSSRGGGVINVTVTFGPKIPRVKQNQCHETLGAPVAAAPCHLCGVTSIYRWWT